MNGMFSLNLMPIYRNKKQLIEWKLDLKVAPEEMSEGWGWGSSVWWEMKMITVTDMLSLCPIDKSKLLIKYTLVILVDNLQKMILLSVWSTRCSTISNFISYWCWLLTCHVGSKGSVRSPAGVPAHNFTPGHQGALIRSTAYKSHRPNRHTSSTTHLQRRKKKRALFSCYIRHTTAFTQAEHIRTSFSYIH